jgi:hypothetical protein
VTTVKARKIFYTIPAWAVAAVIMVTLALQPAAVVTAPTSVTPVATSSTTTSDAVPTAAADVEEPAAEVIAEEPATPPIVPVGGVPDIIASDFASDGHNTMSCANLRPGDIILLGSPDTIFDYLIPGVWSHTVIFMGTVAAGESVWDRTNHIWMAEGTPYCIHSTKSDVQGNGLGYDTFYNAVNAHAGNTVALRIVKAGGVLLTTTDEDNMKAWLKAQLEGGIDGYPVGPGYDFNWLAKQTTVDTGTEPWLPPFAPNGYYCSELAWAMAKTQFNLDLDGDFSPLDVGVSPEDLYWSQYTSVIACEQTTDPNGNTIYQKYDASADLYKVTVFVDEIYYDDDYDPWPSGAGEEYFEFYIGDGYFPVMEQHPYGDGKKGNGVETWVSRDGSGAVNWDRYGYTLIASGAPLKIRICPGEVDDTSGDDWYPAWQWWWNVGGWSGYINGGWSWSGSRADLGDCRYTVYFRIDSCY